MFAVPKIATSRIQVRLASILEWRLRSFGGGVKTHPLSRGGGLKCVNVLELQRSSSSILPSIRQRIQTSANCGNGCSAIGKGGALGCPSQQGTQCNNTSHLHYPSGTVRQDSTSAGAHRKQSVCVCNPNCAHAWVRVCTHAGACVCVVAVLCCVCVWVCARAYGV